MSSTFGAGPPRPSTVADRELSAASGYMALAIALGLVMFSLFFGFLRSPFAMGLGIVAVLAAIVVAKGLVVLQPNESLVCLLFGSYAGTERRAGFWWVNPFYSRKKVSRRLETLECGPLKVNDAVGNPVDIGAVIVWRVEDAAKAVLEVESYATYVKAQSETAVRRMASTHPYDDVEVEEAAELGRPPRIGDGQQPISAVTLRSGGDAIIESLLTELRGRMEPIGIKVDEARISHLAYSSEIAGAMLRKQAASAVVAARRMVVKGAVSIVEDALDELDRKKIGGAIEPERRAAMISNLLVVLVGDHEVTPVINTGTLYP
jgi:regulator of protease activity HflC (stomatin/prohibitin superfamily)